MRLLCGFTKTPLSVSTSVWPSTETRHLQLAGDRGQHGQLEGRVVTADRCVEHGAAVAGVGQRQGFEHRTDGRHLAVGHDHDRGREPCHFGD